MGSGGLDTQAAVGPTGELHRLKGHADAVFSVAISSDGKTIVTGSNDHAAIIWDATTGQALQRLEGHNLGVVAVGFSSDASRVVTGDLDCTARVWDARTGALLAILKGEHQQHVHGAAISPDGTRVLTASCDMTVVLWDVATEKPLQKYRHLGEAFSVAFAPDGKTFLSGCHALGLGNGGPERNLRLYDAQTGNALADFDVETVEQIAYVDGGKRALILGNQVVSSLDLAARKVEKLRKVGFARVDSIGPSADGGKILVGGVFETELVDFQKPKSLMTFRSRESNRAVAISPDGEWGVIAGGGRNNPWGRELQAYQSASDADVRMVSLAGDYNPARYGPDDPRLASDMGGLMASSDGGRLTGFFRDGSVVWWDGESGRERASIKWKSSPLLAGMSADGELTVLLGQDGKLIEYDIAGGLVGSTHVATDDPLMALCPAADRKSVFAGGLRRGAGAVKGPGGRPALIETDVHQFDLGTGKDLRTFRCPIGTIRALALSPDQRTLIGLCDNTYGGESAALAWDVASGQTKWTWRPKPVAATAKGAPVKMPLGPLAVDAAGRSVAVVSNEKTVVVIDLASGKALTELAGAGSIHCVAFDPDDKRIWTAASYDVRSWDRASGAVMTSLKCPTYAFNIAFRFASGKHVLIDVKGTRLIEHELDP
jgi:WD40 repeat protein